MRNWLILAMLTGSVMGAESAGAQRQKQESPIRVFLDCQANGCDFDYFRTEVPFVDYVRDRKDALLHVLVTTQDTGGGGTEYTFNFIGLKELAGASDTLRYVSANSATSDDRRKGIARILKMGLVRYVAHTSAADRLEISYVKPAADAAAAAPSSKDRWNYWVFRTRAGGNFSGESSQRFISVNGSLSANRLTKEWKVNTSVSGNYNESSFTFSEGEKFTSYSRSYGASELIVKALTDHWSAGQRASLTSSTYLNQKLATRVAPAIEYNFFPYSESTRRSLTLQYSAGVSSYRYRDTTIFDKVSEVRPDQSLVASISMTQPWGSVSGSIEGANFLDDFSKRRLVLFNSLNARLFKGFSVNLYGSVSFVRDQLYLPKSGATDEEILLQRQQLATSYRYYAGVSLTYTFGSIFNNVVNPRFDGASGSFFFY
ncbi:MAG: hypothetical protein Q7S20_05145 [Gemmatimonadaceae bacterium]|nr:hypothetical protein [Gemmatimonadaceae bacterium]